MKKIKQKIMHRDSRGLIVDLLENKKINSVAFITQKKGKIRGNHYHKKTIQWNYLLKGKILLFAQKKNSPIKKIILNVGDIVVTEKNEKHATKALKNSEFLVFTQGPRGGKDYEKDTYRLLTPIA